MKTEPTILEPQQIVEALASVCGADGVLSSRVDMWKEGLKAHTSQSVWMRVNRESFRPALHKLADIHYPHLGVITGCDTGDAVELLYHFFIYYGIQRGELLVTLAVPLPKSDLRIPTITDLIPGAQVSEREKVEMLGIHFDGLADCRRMFLPEDFPEGVFPWRRDETGIPDSMIKELWRVGRPEELTPEHDAKLKAEQDERKKAEKAQAAASSAPGEPSTGDAP